MSRTTLDRDHLHTFILVSLIVSALSFAFAHAWLPGSAWAQMAPGESRFGDSTWVAPNAYPEGDPSENGPRVNDPDQEPPWETALRAPFRVAFFPLRVIGEGFEHVADFGEKFARKHGLDRAPSGPQQAARPVRISPRFTMSSTQGFGVGPVVRAPLGNGGLFRGDAIWTTKDNRFLRARALFGEGVTSIGAGVEGIYDYRPNRRFYGIGNDAGTDRTIFLSRETRGEGWLFFGRDSTKRVRALAGISGVHIGNGYGDTNHMSDFFDPADVPFLGRDSRVWSYGFAGQYAAVDFLHEPSRGIHLLGEARRMISADTRDLRFLSWRAEGRAYVPVGADRRVLALRGVYQGVDPEDGSEPVPFYRLPVSTTWNLFQGYKGDRFRDQRLLLTQVEYRWLIWSSSLWAFALAQRGMVAPTTSSLRYSAMHEAYGGGLRYRLSDFSSARLDVTRGSEGTTVRLDLNAEF